MDEAKTQETKSGQSQENSAEEHLTDDAPEGIDTTDPASKPKKDFYRPPYSRYTNSR